MQNVKAKKHLGQHFLTSESIAERIAMSLFFQSDPLESKKQFVTPSHLLEIGPGMGILTKYLLSNQVFDLKVVEIDEESVQYLSEKYPVLQQEHRIILGDFLHLDACDFFTNSFAIIGNFPYNISSQILFHVLEFKDQIPLVAGMFQKEVAERVAAAPGSKTYGILSVLLQAFYDIEYLFTVEPTVFNPPPKVRSGVIRLVRNQTLHLDCDEKIFTLVVKTAFNQRRKTLRNALRGLFANKANCLDDTIFDLRAERLSVADFIYISKMLS
ncbi:MAG: 16S rRNA (adenine(1518)-N(6)/adenine(1519)-N(6))-dimethyltransferase RsmA [Bacteroidales bacterium]